MAIFVHAGLPAIEKLKNENIKNNENEQPMIQKPLRIKIQNLNKLKMKKYNLNPIKEIKILIRIDLIKRLPFQ